MSLTQTSILVLDENGEEYTLYSYLLEGEGASTIGCTSPTEAMNLLKKDSFELVILTHYHKYLHILQFYEQVRKRAIRTPFILITPRNIPNFLSEVLTLGFAKILVKT